MPTLSEIRKQIANGFNEARGEPHTALVQLVRDNVVLSKEAVTRLGQQDPQKSTIKKINAAIADIYREFPGPENALNRRPLIHELTHLISFVADHENEIENVRGLRGNQSDDFDRRNHRVEQSVRDIIGFLTQAPIQVKAEPIRSKEAEKEPADELPQQDRPRLEKKPEPDRSQLSRTTREPLKEANFTEEEQAAAQEALEKARKDLVILLNQKKYEILDSEPVERAITRLEQKEPHLVAPLLRKKTAPHEYVHPKTGERSFLLEKLMAIVLECKSEDRLMMASVLVVKNKLTNAEFRSFVNNIREKDESLCNDINEKGLIRLNHRQVHEFLEANGREVSARLTNEQLALGQYSDEVLSSKVNS